jgi:hypothetical protein
MLQRPHPTLWKGVIRNGAALKLSSYKTLQNILSKCVVFLTRSREDIDGLRWDYDCVGKSTKSSILKLLSDPYFLDSRRISSFKYLEI